MLKDALHSWVVFLEASGLVDARRRAGKLWAVLWRNTLSIEVTANVTSWWLRGMWSRRWWSLDQTVSLASRSLSTVGVVLELAVQQCWYMLMREMGGSMAILE